MKGKCFEALEFYKGQHSGSVVLFRVGDKCMAFGDDAELLSRLFGCPLTVYVYGDNLGRCSFGQDRLEAVMGELLDMEHKVVVVEHRDGQGSFCLPEVKQIMRDMEDDY